MNDAPPVGVLAATSMPPEMVAPLAARTERLGFREIWLAEDYFCVGGLTGAALALQATDHIRVGTGVLAAVARHPAVTAMEIATLARAFPGRFMPGIGHGLGPWTDQMGITARSPLAALEECVTSVRELLAGETVDRKGKQFAFDGIRLTHGTDQEVPILTGVLGPKSLRLSGRIADGTVLSAMAGTAYLRASLKHIEAGMAEAGRTTHLLPTFAMLSIDKDRTTAKAAVRPVLAFYLAAVGPENALTAAYGYNEQLADLLSQGGVETVAREMPDEWVDELTVSGDPDEVTERVNALLDAGATSVVLSPADNATMVEQLQLTSDVVLPQMC